MPGDNDSTINANRLHDLPLSTTTMWGVSPPFWQCPPVWQIEVPLLDLQQNVIAERHSPYCQSQSVPFVHSPQHPSSATGVETARLLQSKIVGPEDGR
jgi:hypothetical protein